VYLNFIPKKSTPNLLGVLFKISSRIMYLNLMAKKSTPNLLGVLLTLLINI